MKKKRILSLIMAFALLLPFAFGVIGCGGGAETEYDITYIGVDGAIFASTNPTTYKSSDGDIVICNPVKAGYEFLGWTGTGLSAATKDVKIAKGSSGNREFTATWKLLTYTIVYAGLEGANVNGINPVAYDVTSDDITLINPTKTGFEFIGWTGTGLNAATKSVTIAKGSTGDRLYTANWASTTYSITYAGMEGASEVSNPTSYTKETSEIQLINPTKTGYEFLGWTGTDLSTATKNVIIPTGSSGNREYTANWALATYSITYTGVEGADFTSANPISYQMTDGAITLVNPTKTNYEFIGWTGTGLSAATMTVTIPAGSTGDREYNANWQTDSAETYNLTFENVDGVTYPDGTNPTTYSNVDANFTLKNPAKTGAEFIGWTGMGIIEPVMQLAIPTGSTGDRTYKANWRYAISYNGTEGASFATANPASYTNIDQAITLVNPTKAGYEFLGWTGTGLSAATKTVTIAAGSNGAKEYTATWSVIPYEISYERLEEATVEGTNPVSYNVESGTITLINPTREGFTFIGWTGTGLSDFTMTVTIPAGSTGDRQYSANWATGDVYTITYVFKTDLDTEVNVDRISNYDKLPKTYNGTEDVVIPAPIPTEKGSTRYMFSYWQSSAFTGNKTSYTIEIGATGNIVLTAYFAVWTKPY